METEIIKSPEGVRNLMAELWANHLTGKSVGRGRVYIVDLPEPTEEEIRIMAANRANRKPFIMDDVTMKTALEDAVGKLGGW